jgi:hypothetical protein
MLFLSKAEVQYLQGQKQVSKSYEYKLKSIIRKKLSNLIENELPLLNSIQESLFLTKFSKTLNANSRAADLTKNSKNANLPLPPKQFHSEESVVLPDNTIEDLRNPSYSNYTDDNEQLYIKSRKKINNYSTRAGGLAWLRYRLDMAGVVGSNPTRPIVFNLQ